MLAGKPGRNRLSFLFSSDVWIRSLGFIHKTEDRLLFASKNVVCIIFIAIFHVDS